MNTSRKLTRAAMLSPALLAAIMSPAQTSSPSGTVLLPQGPPLTSGQGRLPNPAQPARDPLKPFLDSPTMDEIEQIAKGRALTINDAVAIGLVTNKSYASAAAALVSAQARTGIARAALRPQIGLGGNLTLYDRAQVAQFGTQKLTLENQFNDLFNASITLPIDITGQLGTAVSQAQFSEVAAKIDVNRARNQLVFDIRNAFYQALRSEGELVVAQDNLNDSLLRAGDVQKRLAVGRASRFDLITTQGEVAEAQQSVVNAKGQVTLSLAALKNVIGIQVSTPIRITDSGAVSEPEGVVPVTVPPATSSTDLQTIAPASILTQVQPGSQPNNTFHEAQDQVELGTDYQGVVAEALRTRPEILEADAQIAAAKKGITLARRSDSPSLGMSAGYVAQPNAAGFTPQHIGNIALAFSIPLLDGGTSAARTQEARGVLAGNLVGRRSAVDTVTLEVLQAYVTLVQARDRVQVADVALAQAQEAFRLARVRYTEGETANAGVSPQLEVSNAQSALTRAESNRLNALYDYNTARSQLDRAVGRYSYGPGNGFATLSAIPKVERTP